MRIECRYIVLNLTVDILTISLYTINVMLHTAIFCDDISLHATRQHNNFPFFSNNPNGSRQTANFNIQATCHAVRHCTLSNTQSILGLSFSDNVRRERGGERVCYYVDWFGISVNSKACAFGISIVVREQQRDLPRKDTFYRVPNTRG